MITTISIILFVISAFIFTWHILTVKYLSPYTLDIYFGRKGCGKSSTLQRLAHKYNKRGWHCFCDEGNTFQDFVIPINCDKLYEYKLPYNSIVFIDEINLKWDNRDFKQFDKRLQKYFRKQRHKKVKIVMFSQTYDCDLKIRNLADRLILLNKRFRVFCIGQPYVKSPVVLTSLQTATEGRISDDFIKLPFWQKELTYIPKWIKCHDSFEDDDSDYLSDYTDFFSQVKKREGEG